MAAGKVAHRKLERHDRLDVAKIKRAHEAPERLEFVGLPTKPRTNIKREDMAAPPRHLTKHYGTVKPAAGQDREPIRNWRDAVIGGRVC